MGKFLSAKVSHFKIRLFETDLSNVNNAKENYSNS